MSLEFTPLQNKGRKKLFPHSHIFMEGASEIRPGQATIIVALDGSGDCDTLKEAIQRIPSTGGCIYIKEGVYEINEPIEASITAVHIFGSGKATELKFNTSGNPNLTLSNVDYLTISDIYINQVNGTAGIYVSSNNYAVFRNLWINGTSQQGIYVESSGAGFRVQNCLFDNCTGNCLECDSSTEAIITGNIFNNGSNSGISGAYITDSIISNNIFKNLDNDGITLTNAGCDDNIIVGNFFTSITNDNIAINDTGATGNILYGNGQVYKRLDLGANSFKAPGSNGADEVDLGLTKVWSFDDTVQEYIEAVVRIPFDMDRNINPTLQAIWSANATSETAVWQLEYLYRKEGEDMSASAQETLTGSATSSSTSNGLVETTMTGIDKPDVDDELMLIRISRKVGDASDNLTGDINLSDINIKYVSNKDGVDL